MINRKKFGFIFVAFIIVMGTFFGYKYWISQKPFVFAGTLETTKVILSSKLASDIVNLPVLEGDDVKKDDILVEMSCDVYKVLAPQINNDYDRALNLIKKGHISQAEFDILETKKKDNDLKLKWCLVKSPIDGIIITKFVEQGEVVGAGTPLLSVANPREIWAYFYVPHDDLNRLKVGQKVIGILPEAQDKTFTGRILKINEEAEFTPKNVQTKEERTRLVYGVKVQFDNPDLTLKSGMTIESTLLDE